MGLGSVVLDRQACGCAAVKDRARSSTRSCAGIKIDRHDVSGAQCDRFVSFSDRFSVSCGLCRIQMSGSPVRIPQARRRHCTGTDVVECLVMSRCHAYNPGSLAGTPDRVPWFCHLLRVFVLGTNRYHPTLYLNLRRESEEDKGVAVSIRSASRNAGSASISAKRPTLGRAGVGDDDRMRVTLSSGLGERWFARYA